MIGVKKSNFAGTTTLNTTDTFDVVQNGQNVKITLEDLLIALNAVGTLEQLGEVTGTPILDIDGTTNRIRNLISGSGITVTTSLEDGALISISDDNFAALVEITSAAKGDTLYYDAANELWKNTSITTVNSESIDTTATSLAITFDTLEDSVNYSINSQMKNIVDSPPTVYSYIITEKLTSGFTVLFNEAIDSANYTFEWSLIK